MVKIKYLIMVGCIVIIGIWAAISLFQREEKRVKKTFHLLSEWVSKSPGESALAMVQKIKNITSLFDETCQLNAPSYSVSGSYRSDEISGYATTARSQFSQLDLKFYDFHIAFLEKGLAKVNLTGRVTGKLLAGELFEETRELECLLKKIGKRWLFSEIEVVEVLKK